MKVAEGDVAWKAASMSQSFKAGNGTSCKSEFDVERKDLSKQHVGASIKAGTAHKLKKVRRRKARWTGLRMMR